MKFIPAIMLLISLQTALAGEFDWLPDQPGTTKFEVTTANTKMYGLSAADAASFSVASSLAPAFGV